MSWLCCCSSSENPPVNAAPTHNWMMQPIMETIIEWENSDYCAVRVLAFAIKFFGSFILIGTFVGIYPWTCAHEEYLLLKLEGRVAPLPLPAEEQVQIQIQPPAGQEAHPDPRDEQIATLTRDLQTASDNLELSEKNRANASATAQQENAAVLTQLYKKHEAALGAAKAEGRTAALEEMQQARSADTQAAQDRIANLEQQLQQANEENQKLQQAFQALPASQETVNALSGDWTTQSPKASTTQSNAVTSPNTPRAPKKVPTEANLQGQVHALEVENEQLQAQLVSLRTSLAELEPSTAKGDSLHFEQSDSLLFTALNSPPTRHPEESDALDSGSDSGNNSNQGPSSQPLFRLGTPVLTLNISSPKHQRTDTIRMDAQALAQINGSNANSTDKKS